MIPVLPDYVDILQKAEAAKQTLIEARRTEEDRTQDYAARMAVFRELKQISDRLDAARPEMNKASAQSIGETRRFLITAIISLIGLAFIILYGWPAFKKATWPDRQEIQKAAQPPATNSN